MPMRIESRPLSSGSEFPDVEQELNAAIESLRTGTKLLRQSREKFTKEQSDRIASKIAELLDRLDETTRAAQARFSDR